MVKLFAGVQLVSVIFCVVLFMLLMNDSYEKFSNKMTNIGVRFQPMDLAKKIPPCVTVCPLEAFKTRGFFFKEASFLQQTFTKVETFLDGTKYGLNKQSAFNDEAFSTQEIRSVFLGRCYTICQKLPLKEHYEMYMMFFNKTTSVKGWYLVGCNVLTLSTLSLP